MPFKSLDVQATKSIPTFQLYGEIEPFEPMAELGFIHVETISARAGLHDWEIRPHRHSELLQVLLIVEGGGRMRIDSAEHAFRAPALLLVPPTLVHAFAFEPQTLGRVLTASAVFIDQALAQGQLEVATLGAPLAAPIDPATLASLTFAFEAVEREFHGVRLARARAIAAHLALIVIEAARLAAALEPPKEAFSPDCVLVSAFRQLISRHAAQGWSVRDYAAALSVTPGRLTAACRRAAGRSPLNLIHDRLMIDAKRNLIYTCMSAQEISYALGFSDPAYFSRFFAKREGASPQQFRARSALRQHAE